MTRHPLASARIETFSGETSAVAHLPVGGGTMIFRATTEADAFAKADVWRDEQVAKHEPAFLKRQQAAAERKAKSSLANGPCEAEPERAASVERRTKKASRKAGSNEGVTAGETATRSEPDDGAIGAVKGEARLPGAVGVEPPSSELHQRARVA